MEKETYASFEEEEASSEEVETRIGIEIGEEDLSIGEKEKLRFRSIDY